MFESGNYVTLFGNRYYNSNPNDLILVPGSHEACHGGRLVQQLYFLKTKACEGISSNGL